MFPVKNHGWQWFGAVSLPSESVSLIFGGACVCLHCKPHGNEWKGQQLPGGWVFLRRVPKILYLRMPSPLVFKKLHLVLLFAIAKYHPDSGLPLYELHILSLNEMFRKHRCGNVRGCQVGSCK